MPKLYSNDYENMPLSAAPYQAYKIFSPSGAPGGSLVSTVYVSCDGPHTRPRLHTDDADGPFHGTQTQLSRLLSGLCGREIGVVGLQSFSGDKHTYAHVVFKGERY